MEIKLKKDWRAFGEIQKVGTILKINNKKILEFLKENNYIQETSKSKKNDTKKVVKEK